MGSGISGSAIAPPAHGRSALQLRAISRRVGRHSFGGGRGRGDLEHRHDLFFGRRDHPFRRRRGVLCDRLRRDHGVGRLGCLCVAGIRGRTRIRAAPPGADVRAVSGRTGVGGCGAALRMSGILVIGSANMDLVAFADRLPAALKARDAPLPQLAMPRSSHQVYSG